MRLGKLSLLTVAGAAMLAFGIIPASAGTGPGPVTSVAARAAMPQAAPAGNAPLIHGITEQCDNSTLYCLNDWGGGGKGSQVNMYYGGYANDGFTYTQLVYMCHDGHVHASAPYGPCPFTNAGLDSQMNGAVIFSINYHQNNLCVATTSSSTLAIMDACPDALGNGGGWGTINASAGNADCAAGNDYYAENRYWSDAYDSLSSLAAGSQVGNEAYVRVQNGSATCWGQFVS